MNNLPAEGAVDTATQQAIADALKPVTEALDKLRQENNDRFNERARQRSTEQQATHNEIADINRYVREVKEQRDQQIAERPTLEAVRQMIGASAADTAREIKGVIESTLRPIESMVTRLDGAVTTRLADRDEGLQRVDKNLQTQRTRIDQLEDRVIALDKETKAIKRDLFGDPSERDGKASLMGEIQRLNAQVAEAFTRLNANDEAHTEEIAQLKALELGRAQRRKRYLQWAGLAVRSTPLAVKVGVAIGLSSGSVYVMLTEIARLFGLGG